MIRYELREGEYHFTPESEAIVRLPKTSLCICGCEKQCHAIQFGVPHAGACSSRRHECREFIPYTDQHDI